MRSYADLFDLRTANVVANFADEDAAWAALRQAAIKFVSKSSKGMGWPNFETARIRSSPWKTIWLSVSPVS